MMNNHINKNDNNFKEKEKNDLLPFNLKNNNSGNMEFNSINNNISDNMNIYPGLHFQENEEHLDNYNENANLMNFFNQNNTNGSDLFGKNTNENINIDDDINS